MSAKERLMELQATLKAKGVRDVKFFFDKRESSPLSKCAAEVVVGLTAALEGDYDEFKGLGDSLR